MRSPVVPALLVTLCVAGTPALAQQQKSRPRSRQPAPLPMPPPPAAEPEARPAQEEKARGPMPLALAVEGFVGGLFLFTRNETVSVPGGGSVSVTAESPPVFRFGARVSSPFLRLDERASLEWLGTVGVGTSGSSQEVMGFTSSVSVLSVDVLPGLRARFAILPRLSLTGEVGIGLQLNRATTRMTFVGEKAEGSALGVFRFAVGGRYEVDDKLSLFFEPVGLHALVGQGGASGWSMQAGVGYAL